MSANRKIRIQVSVSPEFHAILSEVSAFTGEPLSKLCGGVLEETTPVFSGLLDAFKVASKDQQKARDMIKDIAVNSLVSGAADVLAIKNMDSK